MHVTRIPSADASLITFLELRILAMFATNARQIYRGYIIHLERVFSHFLKYNEQGYGIGTPGGDMAQF